MSKLNKTEEVVRLARVVIEGVAKVRLDIRRKTVVGCAFNKPYEATIHFSDATTYTVTGRPAAFIKGGLYVKRKS